MQQWLRGLSVVRILCVPGFEVLTSVPFLVHISFLEGMQTQPLGFFPLAAIAAITNPQSALLMLTIASQERSMSDSAINPAPSNTALAAKGCRFLRSAGRHVRALRCTKSMDEGDGVDFEATSKIW